MSTLRTTAHDPQAATTDAELIAGLRRGDEAAWKTAVEQFGPRMLVAAGRLLRCQQEAADAVQDAFISAFKSLDSFRGDARLSTWLHRVVVNACLMKIRSRASGPQTISPDLLPNFDAAGCHARPVSRWAIDPASQAISDETRAYVRSRIDMLPEPYRTVLLLRDIEGLDTGETARLLGVSEANIKTRLHRARQALRTLLESRFAA